MPDDARKPSLTDTSDDQIARIAHTGPYRYPPGTLPLLWQPGLPYSLFVLLLPAVLGCGRTTIKERAVLRGHEGQVYTVSFASDGKSLATGGADGTARIWDLGTEKEVSCFKDKGAKIIRTAWTPDGKTLATCSFNRPAVSLWDVATGTVRTSLGDHNGGVSDLAIAPDGRTLATGSRADGLVRLWDLGTGKTTLTLRDHTGLIPHLAFAPDGKTLASGATTERREQREALVYTHKQVEIKLWDVPAGREKLTTQGHTDFLEELRFSPDGKILATSANDGTVKLWDVATGKELATLDGHRGPNTTVVGVAFSPGGRVLATASLDKTILLWNITTRQIIGVLSGDPTPLSSVAFAADGKTVASGHLDGGVRLWDVSSLLAGREK